MIPDPPLVRRLIAVHFPQWADLEVRPVAAAGWDNMTFRLGDTMLVRLPRAERYAAQVAKEQAWLPRLARELPVPIPEPLAMGAPDDAYPWPWSVYRWIEGELPDRSLGATAAFGAALARFLTALQAIDATEGPPAGPHSFFRGGPLATYDAQTREALDGLDAAFDRGAATAVWDAALASAWDRPPVWVHGDYAAGNLLVRDGRLAAVIDFGCMAVGDPACDLAIAWTLLSGEGRAAFRSGLELDAGTWARGRGWTLWKALIQVTGLTRVPNDVAEARRVLNEVLIDP